MINPAKDTTRYTVTGMTCGGCVRSLTAALERALPDVTVEVTLAGGRVAITGEHDPADVASAVADAGFDLATP